MLKARLADPTADAACETLLVAHEVGGSDLDRRLEALVDDRIQDIAGPQGRPGQAGRRPLRPPLRALVPLGMALAGMSVGNGRAAYRTPAGQVASRSASAWSSLLLAVGRPHHAPARRAAGVRPMRPRRCVVVRARWLWAGATLLLSELRWFARRPLTERLRPVHARRPGRARARAGPAVGRVVPRRRSPRSPRRSATAGPAVRRHEDLGTRLRRIHSPLDATAFRVRQLGWAHGRVRRPARWPLAAAACPPALGLLFVARRAAARLPACSSSRSAAASARWQRRLFLELPVVSEQIGMLLSAGYSLGAALNRVWPRGPGRCGRGPRAGSGSRIRQGLTEVEALREWAELADVDALDRLVAVLALNREAGDLGRLISEEARAIRATSSASSSSRSSGAPSRSGSRSPWPPWSPAIFLAVPFLAGHAPLLGADRAPSSRTRRTDRQRTRPPEVVRTPLCCHRRSAEITCARPPAGVRTDPSGARA